MVLRCTPRQERSTNRSSSLYVPSLSNPRSSPLTLLRTQYIDEKFTDPQRENTHQLLSDLNDNLLAYIGRNRFSDKSGVDSLEHVKALTQVGPFSAAQAKEKGLIDGLCYRQDVLDSVLLGKKEEDAEVPKEVEAPKEAGQQDGLVKGATAAAHEQKPENKLMGFYHYHKVLEKAVEKHMAQETIPIGVVYLQGTIGDVGECVAFRSPSLLRPLTSHLTGSALPRSFAA